MLPKTFAGLVVLVLWTFCGLHPVAIILQADGNRTLAFAGEGYVEFGKPACQVGEDIFDFD